MPPEKETFWKKIIQVVKPRFNKIFMPWSIGKPLALPWGAWTKFDNEQKAKYPIRWFFFDTIPDEFDTYWRMINRWVWAIRHRYQPKHKYHIVRTSLKPGYWDPTSQILYATMDTVKEFVDETKDTVAWDSDPPHAETWAELQIVYNWWVNEYPHREEKLPEFPEIDHEKLFGDDDYREDQEYIEWNKIAKIHNQAEIDWAREEEEMLIRVMKVRNFLWYP